MKKILLFLVILLLSFTTYSQEELFTQAFIDTTYLARELHEGVFKMERTLKQDTTLKGWTKCYIQRSYINLRQQKNDSAIYYANLALDAYQKEAGHPSADGIVHKAYYILGLRAYFDGKVLTSIEYLNKGMEFINQFPESPDKASWKYYILERLGIIHSSRGNYNLALEVALEKLENKRVYENQRYESGTTYSEIALLYKYTNKWDSAYHYYHKARYWITLDSLPIEKNYPIESLYLNVVNIYGNLGNLFLEKNAKDSTLYYYRKSYQELLDKDLLYSKGTGSLIRYFAQANQGYVYLEENNTTAAMQILELVKDSITRLAAFDREERDLRLKTHQLLSKAYLQNKNPDKALEESDLLASYLLEYNENSISEQLQMFSSEFELEEKQSSIETLQLENEIKESRVRQRTIINWILLVILLVLIAFGILFYRQKQLKNKYETINLEQRLLRSQLNPHFIFNSLNSILNLIGSDTSKAKSYLLKFSSLLRLILKNSREEFVSLSEEVQATQDYLEIESAFSKKFKYEISIDPSIDVDQVLIPPMFIQPFVENSINHGFSGDEDEKVSISFTSLPQKQMILCSILDNGQGFNKDKATMKKLKKDSFSGSILEDRLRIYSKALKIDARYSIENREVGTGTKVEVFLPIIEDR